MSLWSWWRISGVVFVNQAKQRKSEGHSLGIQHMRVRDSTVSADERSQQEDGTLRTSSTSSSPKSPTNTTTSA